MPFRFPNLEVVVVVAEQRAELLLLILLRPPRPGVEHVGVGTLGVVVGKLEAKTKSHDSCAIKSEN